MFLQIHMRNNNMTLWDLPPPLIYLPSLQKHSSKVSPPPWHQAWAPHSFIRVQVMVKAKEQLGEIMSAFEFLDRQALDLTLDVLPAVENPLAGVQAPQAPFYVLIETAGCRSEHDLEKFKANSSHPLTLSV